jgi:glucosylglycerate phosphorylase
MKKISYEAHTIKERLELLYNKEDTQAALEGIESIIAKYKERITPHPYQMSEKDIVLITYGDQIQEHGEAPLATLKKFLDKNVKGIINSVHILPFYPYSSDDGFSIISYSEVEPKMGSWREINDISKEYRLMVDGVINHVSEYSHWFKAYLAADPEYKDFFIDVDPTIDLSRVIRPRTTPLITEFYDAQGNIHNIWTTFSKDQVDLNYKNYRVLLAVLDALFYYIQQGATLIRLDAIAFIWKEVSTKCVHLPQTHELIQLIRETLHEVAPEVIIITETNVPHKENISYFGSGDDEAQMVYNFALPPLLAHSILNGMTIKLTKWARSLALPSDKVCFFNFTASHDGCGLRPVQSILTRKEIEALEKNTKQNGGFVSYRSVNGKEQPYELNCSYIDILSHPDEEESIRVKRMLLTQTVMLAMPGVPGIYFHSLVGSHNYHEAVQLTGNKRSINREKFNYHRLSERLNTDGNIEKKIFSAYKRIISIRIHERAFDPFETFTVLSLHKSIFAIVRYSENSSESILALHNFANETVTFELPNGLVYPLYDILANNCSQENRTMTMEAYQSKWLKSNNTQKEFT